MGGGRIRLPLIVTARLALQPLRDPELPLRFLRASQCAEAAARAGSAPTGCSGRTRSRAQHPFGRRGLTLLHVGLAEQDVRRAVERIQPDRFLQRGDGLVPLALPHAGVAQLSRTPSRWSGSARSRARSSADRLVEAAAEQAPSGRAARAPAAASGPSRARVFSSASASASNSSRIIICAASEVRRSRVLRHAEHAGERLRARDPAVASGCRPGRGRSRARRCRPPTRAWPRAAARRRR